ncbi:MAG TPA: galactokinase [Gemmatimonadales bacterium]|nr:galactokinase [Gemmatimonadales bacterium]
MTVPIDTLRRAFRERYGAADGTLVLIRAPGRVNLIGEHIDYNGLPVFPVAIQRHVALLARPRGDAVVRVTSLAGGFGDREFTISTEIPPHPTGDWVNYVKAAAQALARHHGPLRGFDAVIGSSLPVASGLSSSSALVIGVALTVLTVNQRPVEVIPLAEEMARAERYTGTQGGGMDQAISLGAREGMATRVDFHPLRMRSHPVPPGWRFVVASSMLRAEKSGPAQARYNERTRECAAALAALAGRVRLGSGGYPELLESHPVEELLALAETVLADPVRRRFRHVVTEAHRVDECEGALMTGDLATFGRALSASHLSLRDDYEVSIPELDELVRIAEGAGAAGARLTGAGMGGCIVAVSGQHAVDDVLAALRRQFYLPRGVRETDDHCFVAEPSAGARAETLT